MRMYVGNPTKQNHEFVYWVPNARSARVQRIPVGGQVCISGELDRDAVDMIVQHHAPYGLAAASEVEYAKDFVGLCYSIDKPIAAATLTKVMVHNERVLAEQGREIRRQTSVAGNEALQRNAMESGRPETLRQMEASILEEDHDERSPDPAVAEGFRVINGGAEQPPPASRRRRNRRVA